MPVRIVHDPDELQKNLLYLKREGKTICVVPTMGALHEGHRCLIEEGRRRGDVLVVTLFVNPRQFAPHEDFDFYPRSYDADVALCEAEGVDYLFAPTAEQMYPPGYATRVDVEGLTAGLCGASRPHFFGGVCTVVAKLFLITQADRAIFGWKDAQQLLVLRRMARDLNIPVEIIGVETVREADGLALSSRNRYLTPEQRAEAVALYQSLQRARSLVEAGERNVATVSAAIREGIERNSAARIDYVACVSMDSLEPLSVIEPGNTLLALAAFWGDTRLIDNLRL